MPPRSAIRHALTYGIFWAILVTDRHIYRTDRPSAMFTSSVDYSLSCAVITAAGELFCAV